MSLAGLLDKTCTIRRVTRTNTGPEPGETWADSATGVPCRISMLRAFEVAQMHNAMAVTHRLYLPYGTDITNDDRVIIDGDTWHVEMVNGDPGSRQHHVEALIKAGT